ncbi:hypothetical protein FFK22_017990 [Mycobacterium sp. KBS0706]|uniref:hypothetical protein n=1 Tax=Mycobacterium sp. KBS0706 TaxID=2578109 RepID=UPI00110FF0AA|nr:hypothetical protein [Mycobacterium sp. KBS0706]TSD87388.1 hypothetical protein FFK22_017990 [Mycobacterium sp. KBS0706]
MKAIFFGAIIHLWISHTAAFAEQGEPSIVIPSSDLKVKADIFMDRENKEFDIYLTSQDSNDLCIDETLWPANGTVDNCVPMGKVRLFLLQDGRVIPYGINLCSECSPSVGVPGECKIRIAPGETISGFLRFKDFAGSIAEDGAARQTLVFPNRAYYCK